MVRDLYNELEKMYSPKYFGRQQHIYLAEMFDKILGYRSRPSKNAYLSKDGSFISLNKKIFGAH